MIAGVMASAVAFAIVACGGDTQFQPPVLVSLIGLNDFHGNIQPPSGSVVVADPANPAGTKVSAGGAAYLATLINSLKAQNPGNTLVVAAGDMIGASPLASGLFHDEPAVDALGLMGLDVSSVGNHEFDKGRDELLRIQNGGCYPKSADGTRGVIGVDTCMNNGTYAGARFQYLAANVIDQKTGATLFPATSVKTVGGVKVGFIGLTLKDTPAVVTPAGVAGLQFTDEVDTVNKLVPGLKAQGVSAIVVLIHQGGATTASSVNDKTCPGFAGDIIGIADKLDPAIDVIVSGHTHQEYICSRPDGKLITQTGFYGRLATKIDLTIDPNTQKVTKKTANNIVAINDVGVKDATGALIPLPAGLTAQAKNATLDGLVQRYVTLTAPITGIVVGNITGFLTRAANAAGESTLGDVIADAFLAGSSDPSYGPKPAVIAFTNPGGIRADLATTLQVTFGQLYNVQPFGNNLTTMDVTGSQLLRLLEQQWESPQPAGGRILPVSKGFSYSWDNSKPAGAAPKTGNRVVAGSMMLNGVAIDAAKTYRITVNSFMASGGDNFTVLTGGTNVQQGALDIDAVSAYFKAQGNLSLPTTNRITRLN
ncbi:MAG: bifunctional metallophosphatase/5'-nucleotidase [Herminiimonas sp.]|nr:bifunctional metallophosphatase/5'-nucleotidase [Herminiimonas sp.]